MGSSDNKMVKRVTQRSEIKHKRKSIKEGYREPKGDRWYNEIYISESRRYARVLWNKRAL